MSIQRKPEEPTRPPTHPGKILADYMEAVGWNQTTMAEAMGVSRNRINKIIN